MTIKISNDMLKIEKKENNMIRIVCDSSTLYSSKEGEKKGLLITPLMVSANGKSYREFDEISSEAFLDIVRQGAIPSSSQPSIGEKMDLYDHYQEDTIIDIAMADGLSGTYQSACMAREDAVNKNNIYVLNSKTLCGPHRYLVNKALRLRTEGKSVEEMIAALNESIDNSISFLIPMDFSFLKRGGRLTPMAATFGGMLKLVPIMTQTKDGTRLEKKAVKRTFKGAIEEVIKGFKEYGVDENYYISISHAGNEKCAVQANTMLSNAFSCEIEMFLLSPAFITQGGPDCVAIQAIKK